MMFLYFTFEIKLYVIPEQYSIKHTTMFVCFFYSTYFISKQVANQLDHNDKAEKQKV